jgi:hypothetical protein
MASTLAPAKGRQFRHEGVASAALFLYTACSPAAESNHHRGTVGMRVIAVKEIDDLFGLGADPPAPSVLREKILLPVLTAPSCSPCRLIRQRAERQLGARETHTVMFLQCRESAVNQAIGKHASEIGKAYQDGANPEETRSTPRSCTADTWW